MGSWRRERPLKSTQHSGAAQETLTRVAGWSKVIDVTRCQEVQPNQAEAKIPIGWSVLQDLGRSRSGPCFRRLMPRSPANFQLAILPTKYSTLLIKTQGPEVGTRGLQFWHIALACSGNCLVLP